MLRFRCSDETRTAFKALARANGMTEASLGRTLVERFLNGAGQAVKRGLSDGRGGRSGRVDVRLTAGEAARIRELSEASGQSAAGWIVALIRERLDKATPFCEAELDRIEAATRALDAVGRNLNMIAARLNRTDRYAEASLEPQRLRKEIAGVREAIDELVIRAVRRVGGEHA